MKIAQSNVVFTRADASDKEGIKEAIRACFHMSGFVFKKAIQKIVIKPNMCYYWDYSTGYTTDPKFVAALINVIREQTSPNVDISIVESDASAMKCRYAFPLLGYEKLAKELNVNLINLSEDPSEINI